MRRGLFITFEGPDGSGKTTQIKLLKEFLTAQGLEAVLTREPGGTKIGELIRGILLDRDNEEMVPMTETLLYAAARAQHVEQVIRPALLRGTSVICDRFTDSSIAYQGYGRRLGDAVRIINQFAVKECLPDVTFLMKVDPAVGKKRIQAGEQDRLEREKIEFHNEVFRGYMELADSEPERIVRIDASRRIEDIAEEIQTAVRRLLSGDEECR